MEIVGPKSYNKFAYPVQMVFLKSRLEREQRCETKQFNYIIDRSIYEDRYIFAENQLKTGQISQEEFEEYLSFFEENCEKMRKLDVVIYIRAKTETLYKRVKERGRDMENGIDKEYLNDLNLLYENSLLPALKGMKEDLVVLVYDTDELGAQEVAEMCFRDIVENCLMGKFN